MKKVLRRFLLDEHAQGMAEYVLFVSLIGVSFYGFWNIWSVVLIDYFNRIATIVSLPLP
jgi:Flp pilus assembly pilin Flp